MSNDKNGNGEEKICEVTYKVKLEWADSESEEMASIIANIACCCFGEGDDNGDDD